MPKKTKSKGVAAEKKHTWRVFSEYIRRRDAFEFSGDADGMAKCCTCKNVSHWKDLQAGHGLAGRNNGILFEEKCCKAQCRSCNVYGGGKPDEYHDLLIDEIGAEGFQELVKQKHTTKRYTAIELKEMRDEYQAKINDLLEKSF